MVRRRIVGRDAQRGAQRGDGLVRPAQFLQRVAQVVVGLGEIGLERERAGVGIGAMALSNAERQRRSRERRALRSREMREKGFLRLELWLPRETANALSQLTLRGSSKSERVSVSDIVALGLRQHSRNEAREAQKRAKMDVDAQRAFVSDLRAQELSWEKIVERLNEQKIADNNNWTIGRAMKLFG